MAKIYKTEIYILDYNAVIYSIDHFENVLKDFGYDLCVGVKIANIKESKEFEWNDDLKINQNDSAVEDFEEYFKQ